MSEGGPVLAAVCDTFLPERDGLPSASALGVPALMLSEIRALGRPSLLRELSLFLRIIDTRAGSLAIVGRPVRFSRLGQADREAYLRRLAASPLPLARTAFQDLKRLTYFYAYGIEDSPYRLRTGYAAAPLDAPDVAPLRVRRPRAGEAIEADVCVIGSGAGGGAAAAELARDGRSVVVLERAALVTEQEYDGRELSGFARLFLDRGLTATADRAIAIRAGSAVGGGTIVNWSTSLRLPDEIREEWRAAGIDGLDEHYDALESRCDVDTDESPRNGPNAMLERGLRARGLAYRTIPRNVRGCGDCGPCAVGCRRGAKRSATRTTLADACRDGAEILDGVEAEHILVRQGRVEAVSARVDGGTLTVRAPVVVLAAGALRSPTLLMRSGIAPGRIGAIHLHPCAAVVGHYEEPLDAWAGVPQSVVSEAFARLEGSHGFRIECAPAHPAVIASAVPWWGSADHAATAAKARHFSPMLAIVRDRTPGRVDIDRDGATRVRYFPAGMERRLLVRGMVELARIHHAAGAYRIGTLHTPPLELLERDRLEGFVREIERRAVAPNRVLLFSAHQMSSCRIGTDRDAVADPDGQVRGVRGLYVADASAFPSASGVNPMLTIMALARRTARGIAAGR
ncbi:MAG TPA: FAD-dependent oxidoreductase [Candidatus Limnocylindria bacterium]|nr:FAD-dependent oxidoreductase [Candidatus Limnocylindria bacterium]